MAIAFQNEKPKERKQIPKDPKSALFFFFLSISIGRISFIFLVT